MQALLAQFVQSPADVRGACENMNAPSLHRTVHAPWQVPLEQSMPASHGTAPGQHACVALPQ
jgi:hypothetical protein